MDEVLDRHVPRFDAAGDWDDVLHRARPRRPRARLLALAVGALAAFVVAPALAVLLRNNEAHLPAGADRSNVIAVLQPQTGRVLLEAAPWKGHDGFCYLVLQVRAGCVPRSHQTAATWPPLFGWTFDARVRAGTATTTAGKHVPLTVQHFGGRIDATLFLLRGRLPRSLRDVVLRDAGGHVVTRLHIRR
jgi:hypothetical protein